MTYYLAIDIGASSGRHILGWVENGHIEINEVYRFDNNLVERGGHLCWDLDALFGHITAGLRACAETGRIPATIGIDTWGVDYVLLDQNGAVIGDTFAYRDARTVGADTEVESILPFFELYGRTGIQKLQFNTIYQLWALRRDYPDQLECAEHLLMIPDYLAYRLTGEFQQEYTNATTTALVNAADKCWDFKLIDRLALPNRLFRPLSMPGARIGALKPEIAVAVGFDCAVVLPATHDTGSAFLAIPSSDETAVTISSGTWSLLGVENDSPITTDAARCANFTNEGGYAHRFRILKNIMGLWMLQSVRRDLNKQFSFAELEQMARQSAYSGIIDLLDNRFLAPDNMIEAVREACRDRGFPIPADTGETVQCIYSSLAACYADTIRKLEQLTQKRYTAIHIVGGGCKDAYLNQLTADAADIPVFAGPTEATALGNLMAQMIADGAFSNLQQARAAIANSFEIQQFHPSEVQ